MRILASVILTVVFLMFARMLHEGYYERIDRPELFTDVRADTWVINVLAGVVLLLIVVGGLALVLNDKIIVPATIAVAVALWSLSIRISPEHRDWDEQWFGLYFTGIPIAMMVTGLTEKISSKLARHKDVNKATPGIAPSPQEP